MTTTTFATIDNVNKLVQTIWSPLFMKELRENTLWAGLINPTYGPFKGGDTTKVSRINKPTSTIKTVGTDADSFSANVLSSTQVDLKVDKRAVSAFKFEDLAIVMSQLEQEESEIREALLSDCKQQVNDFIKSQISPSAAAPDHVLTGVTDFNAAQLSAIRLLAGQAKWPSDKPWYLLVDPTFLTDIMDDTTLASADYGAADAPIIQGKVSLPRMNFNIIEDNSLSADTGFAFTSDFMLGALGEPVFKVSDLHPLGEFGFVISCDVVFGVKQWDDTQVISIA